MPAGISPNYRFGGRPRYIYQGGKTLQWDDSLGTYIEPYKKPTFETGGGPNFDFGGGPTAKKPSLQELMSLINSSLSGGPSLPAQRPSLPPVTTRGNPEIDRMRMLTDRLANYRPATSLPPELVAQLETQKRGAIGNLEAQGKKSGDQLAGLLYQNFMGEPGSAGEYYKAQLGGELARARGDVESNFSRSYLDELNQYNTGQLNALQSALGGSGATAGVFGSDIDRELQAAFGNRNFDEQIEMAFLQRALEQERGREGSRQSLISQLLSQYF